MMESRVVEVRRRLSRAEADRLVGEYEQSCMKRTAFCRARGVSAHTLDYYRRKSRERMPARKPQLLPVELVEPTVACSPLRIELSNGRQILVEEGFSASLLKSVVAALEA